MIMVMFCAGCSRNFVYYSNVAELHSAIMEDDFSYKLYYRIGMKGEKSSKAEFHLI